MARLRTPAQILLTAVLVLLMLTPLLILVMYSVADSFTPASPFPTALTGRWFGAFWENPCAVSALVTSLILATASTAGALLVGLPLAWAIARYHVRGAAALEGTALLRSAVPVIVLGLGTAAMLYRVGYIDTWTALIGAHMVGCLPFVLLAVRPALTGLDSSLLEAAQDLGAGPRRRFILGMRIVAPSIVSAALYSFIFSLDEFGLTFLISGIDIVTLPVLLYGAVQSSSVSAAAAVSVVLLVPSAAVCLLAVYASRRSDVSFKGASA